MAINPLSVPNFSVTPYSGGADFSQLANLGNVYQEGQMQNRRLAVLGQLGSDPTQNAMLMIKSGDPQMAQHGIELMNQVTQQQRQNALLGIQQKELTLKQEAAEKDTYDYRLEMIKKVGMNPNDPQVQEYLTTGQNFPNRRVTGGIEWGTRTNPETGEPENVPMQRDTAGNLVPAQAPPGVTLTPPGEIAAQKSQKTRDEIYAQQEAIGASVKAIQNADRAEELARRSFHAPFGMAEPFAAAWQFTPEGTPGKERAVATRQLANEALSNMVNQVRPTFGGRSSTKQDQWLKDVQAAPTQSLQFQLDVIDRGRKLAKENQWIAQQKAQDLSTGAAFRPGYTDPSLRVPEEIAAPTRTAMPTKPAAAAAPSEAKPANLNPMSERQRNQAKMAIAKTNNPKGIRESLIKQGYDPEDIGQ
jgi:hypothetical protein